MRPFNGYDAYNLLDLSTYLSSRSTALNRLLLRYSEVLESLRIVYSCIYLVVEGAGAGTRASGSGGMSMELVIREFLGNHPQWVGSGSSSVTRVESGETQAFI